MIVAQARLPCFYRDYAVADTVNGRFDLIVLHLALVLDRLAQDPALRSLGQGVFDQFCQDMDHNLREMGIGDLKVPKEMQRMGEAFYGRAQAYRAALAAADDQALVEAWPAISMAGRRRSRLRRPGLRPICARRYVIWRPRLGPTGRRHIAVSGPGRDPCSLLDRSLMPMEKPDSTVP